MQIPKYLGKHIVAHVIAGPAEYHDTTGRISVRDGRGDGNIETNVEYPHAWLTFTPKIVPGDYKLYYDVVIDTVVNPPLEPDIVRHELAKYGRLIAHLSQLMFQFDSVTFYMTAETENLIKGPNNPGRRPVDPDRIEL